MLCLWLTTFHEHHGHNFVFFLSAVDDSALHPASFQERCREANAQEVRAHSQVPSVQEAKEHVRGHPYPAQVSTGHTQPNTP